ncbi:hypothetical protein PV10_04386 [Exophiala mesophila]|uniref:SPX domain-containing protein n=1 Tax=Exophiala mesophila TaxID=212818 RepID=A0A0D2A263_EXOME|nr:uncharacterized protein PV10_04386 [Exophiala mesophila]KIV93148.1 hypothetical protein PV10_04386 [Exophiala mesophila]
MKFAKELEEDAVPEWRVKYLNYKAGKKKIKAVSRALKAVNRTPATPARPPLLPENSSERVPFTHYDFTTNRRPVTGDTFATIPEQDQEDTSGDGDRPVADRQESRTLFAQSPPILIQGGLDNGERSTRSSPERQPLEHAQSDGHGTPSRPMNYGSIAGSPPQDETPGEFDLLELPDPALSPAQSRKTKNDDSAQIVPRRPESAQLPGTSDSYHDDQPRPPPKKRDNLAKQIFKNRGQTKSTSASGATSHTFPRSRLRRIFTAHRLESPTITDSQLNAYKELDTRQGEFFAFLDSELVKIEAFYKSKEEEASERLQVLRHQLHEMRDRRIADIQRAKQSRHAPNEALLDGIIPASAFPNAPLKSTAQPNGSGPDHKRKHLGDTFSLGNTIGKTSTAMIGQSSPPDPRARARIENAGQDYVRHKNANSVSYHTAKSKLKSALQEFYRALELLKSYAILNRTGFRKINKKYDKAVQARPPLRYMAEKVNTAYFVQSDVVDNYLIAVEDLYARYFERGNHKIAVRKLRSRLTNGDQSATTFRNGLYVASGSCFAIAGLVDACDRLFGSDPVMALQTSYLLQLYAGYFLAVLLFLIFVLDCGIWSKAHVNYVFVFEYDTRHVLDWRSLAELPCFFLFLNGIFIYLNFRQTTENTFFLFWPVLLVAITLVIMALPFKVIYPHARKWWGYSNWRLLFAGLYPVEFRDFFLGDMYCSQTYAMGQIEVFFCLYANNWVNPSRCNSNHSRLLGFFAALPAVWRSFQCLRRYYDSKNWFPHLANFAKYCCNILYYMTLSIYRIDKTPQTRAAFIVFATINGIYTSFWDVFMDFSLGNPWAKHPFLRDQLAYKKVWVYYFAMIADVVLRQQWIFFAIFTADVQHSAIMSFFVSLAEVLRRGMWSLFRVENEHCNNVGKFRASRDMQLPYDIPTSPEYGSKKVTAQADVDTSASGTLLSGITTDVSTSAEAPHATGVDLEQQVTSSPSLRQRHMSQDPSPRTPGMRALARVGTVIAAAHAQDFEKRRRPELESQSEHDPSGMGAMGMRPTGESSDEDEDDDDVDYDENASEAIEGSRSEDEDDAPQANPHVRRARNAME